VSEGGAAHAELHLWVRFGAYIHFYMKRMLVEIDDRTARDLERVAPAKERKRAEFIRLAIRRALDLALEPATKGAYARHPLPEHLAAADLEGWDPNNRLAVHAAARPKSRAGRGRGRHAA
jgi:hypothetical protein